MTEQRLFADAIRSNEGRTTRRERFLAEMDQLIPWATVEAPVEPYCQRPGRDRRPPPTAKMLRISFLRQRLNLSDPQAEDTRYVPTSMRCSARIDLL